VKAFLLPDDTDLRKAAVRLILDKDHYDRVVMPALEEAKVSLWIATANLKDVHIEAPIGTSARARGRYISVTERLTELAERGVEVRILHAATPSGPFRASLKKRREKRKLIALRQCPRVHLKLMMVDGASLYLGSANFTGAGLGAKNEGRRNFELGISTDDDVLLDQVQARFDRIWRGTECKGCQLRSHCPKPIDTLDTLVKRRPRIEQPSAAKPRG
jgi:phosphatidylserine/phosphatidylglycerophosphate/cardiolipin synthase-like enzyme